MSRTSPKPSRPLIALLLGLLVTALVGLAHRHWPDNPLERLSLDLRYRCLADAKQYPLQPAEGAAAGITLIDIDAPSLQRIGPWPWPRTYLAWMIDELHAAGAKAVVLDVPLPDPQEPRLEQAGLAELYSAGRFSPLGAGGGPRIVLPDMVLADALADAPDTYVAFHAEPGPAANGFSPAILNAVAANPAIDASELARAAGVSGEQAAAALQPAKLAYYSARLASALRAAPDASFEAAVAAGVGSVPPEGAEARELLARAYLRQRALDALARGSLETNLPNIAPPADITPPMVLFVQSAARAGFVSYRGDGDGVLRGVPLLVRGPGGMFKQLALAAALDELARAHGGPITLVGHKGLLEIVCADEARRLVQLENDGRMLINWTAATRDWPTAFPRVPAQALLAVAQSRQAADRNADRRRRALLRMAEALQPPSAEQPGQYAALAGKIAADYGRLEERTFQRQQALLFAPDPTKALPAPTDLVNLIRDEQIRLDALGAKLLEEVRLVGLDQAPAKPAGPEPPAASQPADLATSQPALEGPPASGPWPAYRAALARYQAIHQGLQTVAQVDQANADLAAALPRQADELAQRVGGRICLIGPTAAGVADFAPTPMNPRTPGLLVQANVLNTILTGQFIYRADAAMNLMVVLLAGVIVSLLAAHRPAGQGAIFCLLLVVGFVAFNALLVFGALGMDLVLAAPVAAMLLAFAAVAGYRHLAEGRQDGNQPSPDSNDTSVRRIQPMRNRKPGTDPSFMGGLHPKTRVRP